MNLEATETYQKRKSTTMSIYFTHRKYETNLHFLHYFRTPPSALTVETRYEALLGMFSDKGYFVKTIPELRQSLQGALLVRDRPTILNVIISPTSGRKPQTFNWLTESKL